MALNVNVSMKCEYVWFAVGEANEDLLSTSSKGVVISLKDTKTLPF